MKVINKDNIESFKKKNKIKEWVNYLVRSFIEGIVLIICLLLSIALAFAPIVLFVLIVVPKHVEIGCIAIFSYILLLVYMCIAIDCKQREDKRKW